jgi:hypothetical protein
MAGETYALDLRPEAVIPWHRPYDAFTLPRRGRGYLAGTVPDGVTRVEGEAASATVRVLLRARKGHPGDGALIEEVVSASNGEWRVDGLPETMKYDVVGRLEGYNDVIVAGVTPAVD